MFLSSVASTTRGRPLCFQHRSDTSLSPLLPPRLRTHKLFPEGEPSRWSPSPRTPTRQNSKPAVSSPAAPTRQKEHGHTGCVTWMACFFSYLLAHLRIGPRRLFGPRPHLSVVEALGLTDTLTGLTDTPLSDFPSFNLPQITSTRRVRAWASGSMESACLDVWSAVRPCSIGSNLHTTTRRALGSPHLPSRPLSTMSHEYYGLHIARMMVSCLKSSLSRMAASRACQGDG
jgi:hypothetical protein